jgi:hypothetical protein
VSGDKKCLATKSVSDKKKLATKSVGDKKTTATKRQRQNECAPNNYGYLGLFS